MPIGVSLPPYCPRIHWPRGTTPRPTCAAGPPWQPWLTACEYDDAPMLVQLRDLARQAKLLAAEKVVEPV